MLAGTGGEILMARLRVRLRGKITQEIQLVEDRVYIAGRREDCDILLESEKGISREHFKVFFADGGWRLEVLSRFGDVLVEGEKIQQALLEGKALFYLGPYEFEYSEVSADLVPSSASRSPLEAKPSQPSFEDVDENEKTVVGAVVSVPFIKVVDESGDTKELFKLEGGDTWVAGRDSSCDIVIRDQRVSRRQFEVRRRGSQFLILDLGSVNGTLMNGTPISSTDPVPVKSGDAISVLENHLYFELHDPDFKARMELVKASTPNPLVATRQDVVPLPQSSYIPQPMPGYGYPMQGLPGGVLPTPPSKKFDFEKHRVKLIAGAVAFLAIAYVFSGSDSGPGPASTAPGAVAKPGDAFNKLTPEQQILVKQTYLLAKNLYMQGKYELAKAEVVKIYEMVPEYEDTKDIERLANEALVIQDQKRQQEERLANEAANEERAQKQAAECKAKINPNMTLQELDECLAPALSFVPQHSAYTELRSRVQELMDQKQVRDTQKAEYQSQVQRLKGLYSRAESSHKGNNYLKALKEYQSVISSSLPDPGDLKTDARRNVANIQQTLKQKTDQYAQEAEQSYRDQKIRDAILTLRKSLEVDPDNEDIKDKIARYTMELKKLMMVLYQEGVLEESYGNVEGSENRPGAKDKWKKILDQDIPDGEYYGKARIKLKKYGAL